MAWSVAPSFEGVGSWGVSLPGSGSWQPWRLACARAHRAPHGGRRLQAFSHAEFGSRGQAVAALSLAPGLSWEGLPLARPLAAASRSLCTWWASWEDAAAENYAKRLRGRTPAVEVETVCHKSDGQLMRALGKVQHPLLVLDERGAFVNSEEFTDLLFDSLQAGGARLGFVIGGADGLPDELRQVQKAQLKKEGRMRQLLSLGRLTLPHRLARVVLVEQIYRAQEIRRGSSYHRGEPK
ncbi:unnamed protein product [Effrenium voratum]|uniref:Ribosomal RNA large subunit methyltransferase H n=1 Tax=Effrenium voratum TaxID=2562239 RepID=A0AA36JAN0_9DINO|nr:unnamed protein product [Effrenium voratum]